MGLVHPQVEEGCPDREQHAERNVDSEVAVVAERQLDDLGDHQQDAPPHGLDRPPGDSPCDDRGDHDEDAGRCDGTADDLVGVQLGRVPAAEEEAHEYRTSNSVTLTVTRARSTICGALAVLACGTDPVVTAPAKHPCREATTRPSPTCG